MSLAFSRDGKLLASGGRDGAARIWDVASGKEKIAFQADSNWDVRCLAFRPDGKLLAAGGRVVRIWDLQTHKEKRVALEGKVYLLRSSAALSPDGKRLAIGSGLDDPWVQLWDVDTGKLKAKIHWNLQGGDGGPIAFSSDGTRLAAWGDNGVLRVWEMGSGKRPELLHSSRRNTRGETWVIAFSSNGKLLASGGRDRVVRLWDAP